MYGDENLLKIEEDISWNFPMLLAGDPRTNKKYRRLKICSTFTIQVSVVNNRLTTDVANAEGQIYICIQMFEC